MLERFHISRRNKPPVGGEVAMSELFAEPTISVQEITEEQAPPEQKAARPDRTGRLSGSMRRVGHVVRRYPGTLGVGTASSGLLITDRGVTTSAAVALTTTASAAVETIKNMSHKRATRKVESEMQRVKENAEKSVGEAQQSVRDVGEQLSRMASGVASERASMEKQLEQVRKGFAAREKEIRQEALQEGLQKGFKRGVKTGREQGAEEARRDTLFWEKVRADDEGSGITWDRESYRDDIAVIDPDEGWFTYKNPADTQVMERIMKEVPLAMNYIVAKNTDSDRITITPDNGNREEFTYMPNLSGGTHSAGAKDDCIKMRTEIDSAGVETFTYGFYGSTEGGTLRQEIQIRTKDDTVVGIKGAQERTTNFHGGGVVKARIRHIGPKELYDLSEEITNKALRPQPNATPYFS